MRIPIYRLKAWKGKRLVYTFEYEFKHSKLDGCSYEEMKSLLRSAGYRVEEGLAWSWWK